MKNIGKFCEFLCRVFFGSLIDFFGELVRKNRGIFVPRMRGAKLVGPDKLICGVISVYLPKTSLKPWQGLSGKKGKTLLS